MSAAPRILLVDDEAAVTRLLAKYLERLGYAVDICASGEDALAQFEPDPARWGLVLTDLSLPGIRGDDMLRAMLSKHPGLRAIVSSGYPFSVETLPTESPKQIAFLQKPYLPNMLAETLTKMMKRPKAGGAETK